MACVRETYQKFLAGLRGGDGDEMGEDTANEEEDEEFVFDPEELFEPEDLRDDLAVQVLTSDAA